MQDIVNRKNILRAFFVILGLVIIYIGWLFIHDAFFFFPKSASPRNGSSISSTTTQAVITFSKPLKADQDVYKDIKISPQTRIYDKITIDKNKLIIHFVALNINTPYSITFKKVEAANGKVINDFTYSFKTKYVKYSSLSPSEQKQAMAGVDKGNQRDPILAAIPHSTLNYEINPLYKTRDDGTSYFTVQITILLTNSDAGNEAAATEKYKAQALDYIRSQGFDPANYTIDYAIDSSIYRRAN